MTLAMNICTPIQPTFQSTSCELTLDLFVTSVWTLWCLASYFRTRHQTNRGSPPTSKYFVDERSELMFSIADHAHLLPWQYFKTLKYLAQKECHQAYNDYFSKLINSSSTANSKNYGHISKGKNWIPLSHNDHTITDSTHKANILNDYFSSVFTTKDTQSTLTPDESPYPDIQPISFTYADVSQLLTTLEVHKAPGPDLLQLASQDTMGH